jgi:peroxiredoxin Q/BCP
MAPQECARRKATQQRLVHVTILRAGEAPKNPHRIGAMLQPGQAAPSFELPDADMQPVSLSAFKGKKHVVLYFYPRDGTPGCTLVTAEFSDHEDEFGKHDCVVFGVSPDDCLTHADFRDRNGLSIALLSDPEGRVCRQYGVQRGATFVIDKQGVIRHAAYDIKPRGHAAEVFDLVKRLRA